MKRRYWVFLFAVVLGVMSIFFTLRSEVYVAVAARPATQGAMVYTHQIAYKMEQSNVPTKYGECIRISRRIGADCLR